MKQRELVLGHASGAGHQEFSRNQQEDCFGYRTLQNLVTSVKWKDETFSAGTTIGRYAMIGAGAVVKADVPDYAIVAGVPARQIGWACKCGTTVRFNDKYATCDYCNSEYGIDDNRFTVIKEEI